MPLFIAVAPLDPVVFRKLLGIEKVIADESCYKGEHRHSCVESEDPVVRENVYPVVLRIGRESRESFVAGLAAPAGQTQRKGHDQAA